jgi:hypothetical protein
MLNPASLEAALEAALLAFLTNAEAVAKLKVLEAFEHGMTFTDPGSGAQAREEVAERIAASFTADVAAAGHVGTLATALAAAVDAFVRPAVVTVLPLDLGLQTSTPPGSPTAGPAAPATITGGLS